MTSAPQINRAHINELFPETKARRKIACTHMNRNKNPNTRKMTKIGKMIGMPRYMVGDVIKILEREGLSI